jgi:2-C-methyl-D-erythritol 4-phosphate cytidylyltransferase
MAPHRVVAIVVAGGSGERLGVGGGKQLAPLAGRPVLSWSLLALDAAPEVDLIVVVCHPDRVAEYREVAVAPLALGTPVTLVPGGDTRRISVAAGLAAVPVDFDTVLVHDGARPLLTAALVTGVLGMLAESGAAGVVAAHRSVDTLKLVVDGVVVETPDRDRYWAVQTPQVFVSDVLRTAHAEAAATGFEGTDDASLVERCGGEVRVFEAPRDNVKVTLPGDLEVAEAILGLREEAE